MMSPITKLKIFLILNSIQGIVTLIALVKRYSSVMNTVFFNYSTKELILLSFVLLLNVLLIWLSVRMYLLPNNPDKILVYINKSSWSYYLVICFTWFICIYLHDHYPLYLSILIPILIWIEVFFFEAAIFWGKNSLRVPNYLTKKFKWLKEKYIGFGLLLLTGIFGYQVRYINTFADEGDHIANGWLISNGYVLYQDIFSHHPPLINYWVGWIIELFGQNISSIRFSVVFFLILIFVITSLITKYYIPLGLTALIWVIISPFYFGNLAIYQVFSGILIVSSISTFLSIVESGTSTKKFVWLGISNGILISNDPQMVWPILFIYIGVFIAIFSSTNKSTFVKEIYRVFISLFIIFVIGIAWLIYFWLNGAINDVINNLVIFNTETYSKYAYSKIFRLPEIVKNGLGLLSITDHRWFREIDLSPLNFYTNPDETLYSGFFYRFTTLVFVLYYLINKRSVLGLVLYCIICSLFPRSDTWFHAIPFVFTSLFLFSLLMNKGLTATKNKNKIPDLSCPVDIIKNFFRSFKIVTLLLCLILITKAVSGLIANREMMSYEYNFGWLEDESEFISNHSCGIDNWHYANYPLNPLMYFFLEKQPINKYTFMTPWVAEVGQKEVIQSLEESKSNIISVWKKGSIWGYPVEEYLSDLLDFLGENYIEVSPNLWVSPDIYQHCYTR